MKIYFLSSRPCALTVNGAYFGVVNGFERFAQISLKDGLFLSFTPENAHPISFFLTEEILFRAPTGVEVYRTPHALVLYARDFAPLHTELVLHKQLRLENALITVFTQGETQCTVQTEKSVFTATLPPSFTDCAVEKHGEFYLFYTPERLCVFHENGKRLWMERVISFSIRENELRAVLPLSDSLQRTAECTFLLTPDKAERTEFILKQPDSLSSREGLLFFAFLESLLLQADPTPFLCEDLLAQVERLKEFLGEFLSVVLTDEPLRCGLVYPKGERIFEVRYFTAEMKNGKIIDVKG